MAETPAIVPAERMALTVPEAAKLIGVGQAMLWRMVKAGKVPSIKMGTRRIIPVEQLRAWLAEQVKVTQLAE